MLNNHYRGSVERYRREIGLEEGIELVSLGEGGTPLVHAPHISRLTGCEVYLKLEGCNPTGSFKDRGMSAAVTVAKREGVELLLCASTGNTSASAAAYGARSGIRVAVIVPGGYVAQGKMVQALIYGGEVVQIAGNFDDALNMVRALQNYPGVGVVNSINPWRIAGQKTGAYEIVEDLGGGPTYHFIPVGNAGNITAYWLGYKESLSLEGGALPIMRGVQAAHAAPLVLGEDVLTPETIASAIRIGRPASKESALRAVRESGGSISAVSDERILEAYKILAKYEGVFVEPASAASVAGLLADDLPKDSVVVCTLTGNGLKDPETALGQTSLEGVGPNDLEYVKRVLKL